MRIFNAKVISLGTILVSLTVPIFVFAQGQGVRFSEQADVASEPKSFCGLLDSRIQAMAGQDVIRTRIKFIEEMSVRENLIQENRFRYESDLSKKRMLWEKNYLDHVESLNLKATTAGQKQAVSDLATSIRQAIYFRNMSYGKIMNSFRRELDNLFFERKAFLLKSLMDYESGILAARTEILRICESDANSITRAEEAARKALTEVKGIFSPVQGNMAEFNRRLIDIKNRHNTELEKTVDDFREALDSAKQEFVRLAN